MEGAGQVNNCYICEIAPAKSLKPQRQLFEEAVARRGLQSQMAKHYEKFV
jgi:hypothetical protein